jgi:hypothetical protein
MAVIVTVYFVAMCVNVGMWFERFAIIALSLHRDFLPSSWGMYYPTWVDVSTYVGTVGLFVTLRPCPPLVRLLLTGYMLASSERGILEGERSRTARIQKLFRAGELNHGTTGEVSVVRT